MHPFGKPYYYWYKTRWTAPFITGSQPPALCSGSLQKRPGSDFRFLWTIFINLFYWQWLRLPLNWLNGSGSGSFYHHKFILPALAPAPSKLVKLAPAPSKLVKRSRIRLLIHFFHRLRLPDPTLQHLVKLFYI